MDGIKRTIGVVQVLFEGKPVRVNVFEDGTVIMPDGSVKGVSGKVVAALKMRAEQGEKPAKNGSPSQQSGVQPGHEERSACDEPVEHDETEHFIQDERGGLAEFLQSADRADSGLKKRNPRKERTKNTNKGKLRSGVLIAIALLLGGLIAGYIYWPQLSNAQMMQYIVEYRGEGDFQVLRAEDEDGNAEQKAEDSNAEDNNLSALDGENVSVVFFVEIVNGEGEKHRVHLSSIELSDEKVVGIYDGQGINIIE